MKTIETRLAILGAGPGGYVAAIRAAQLGLKPVLIEKENMGGICLNHGCIPSKALIHASEIYHGIGAASKIGIKAENVTVDFSKVMAWKARVVKKLTMGVGKLVQANGGTVIYGQGCFADSNTIDVQTSDEQVRVKAARTIIATGASPVELPFLPFNGQVVVSSKEALAFDKIPDSMLVIGGGIIGLELGQVYARFGTRITIVEALDRLLPVVPDYMADPLIKQLRRLKVKYFTSAKAVGAEIRDGSAKVKVQIDDGSTHEIEADKVLVTVGLKPNSSGFGLENTQVQIDDRGFIRIDGGCRTSDPSLLAIGDVTGEPLLAHKASAQALVAADVANGRDSFLELEAIPSVVYTDPEIAGVGMTEEQALKLGREVITGTFPFAGHGRAAAMDKLDGFIKTVAEKDSHMLLGVQIVGAGAGELIGEAVLALQHQLRVEDLATTIHPHPTMSEGITEAAEASLGKAIHLLTRA